MNIRKVTLFCLIFLNVLVFLLMQYNPQGWSFLQKDYLYSEEYPREEVYIEVEEEVEGYPVEITEDYTGSSEESVEETEDRIYLIADKQPEPYGGMPKFYKYISENLKYPEKARKLGVEGVVFIQFTIEKDGSLTDFGILRGIGLDCEQAAIEVLKNAPHWRPGMMNGEPVRVKMSIPIKFRLNP